MDMDIDMVASAIIFFRTDLKSETPAAFTAEPAWTQSSTLYSSITSETGRGY